MLELAKKILKFYIELNQEPTLDDLEITNDDLLNNKWSIFVTLYKNWEVVWSAWNIVELEPNKALELIKSCIWALNDRRFVGKVDSISDLKIRIDEITSKETLKDKEITQIIPQNSWVIVIKKDYDDLGVILPWISPNINTWNDLVLVLNKKLKADFVNDDYIIYEIKTNVLTDF